MGKGAWIFTHDTANVLYENPSCRFMKTPLLSTTIVIFAELVNVKRQG